MNLAHTVSSFSSLVVCKGRFIHSSWNIRSPTSTVQFFQFPKEEQHPELSSVLVDRHLLLNPLYYLSLSLWYKKLARHIFISLQLAYSEEHWWMDKFAALAICICILYLHSLPGKKLLKIRGRSARPYISYYTNFVSLNPSCPWLLTFLSNAGLCHLLVPPSRMLFLRGEKKAWPTHLLPVGNCPIVTILWDTQF